MSGMRLLHRQEQPKLHNFWAEFLSNHSQAPTLSYEDDGFKFFPPPSYVKVLPPSPHCGCPMYPALRGLSKRIWSRIQHAVTKTFSKKSDSVSVGDAGGHERSSRASHKMSGSLPTTGASSVRDQDVTRPSRRLYQDRYYFPMSDTNNKR
ncbi:hypothetical protein CY34DRAFT_297743 [Suillus luteus UH-Slu-Lm8-n1]|uniref:Uncharacterized protein n=1 Tax=Suillus luteus UH-Slu-Lm8-n1 TaxID=930992 RepID=A0A0C9ZQA2_9AGAM|nr:hypothetical protein CY34DRAFT_297743 [Suillus luteus UH-Slu-Lm8-n1]